MGEGCHSVLPIKTASYRHLNKHTQKAPRERLILQKTLHFYSTCTCSKYFSCNASAILSTALQGKTSAQGLLVPR